MPKKHIKIIIFLLLLSIGSVGATFWVQEQSLVRMEESIPVVFPITPELPLMVKQRDAERLKMQSLKEKLISQIRSIRGISRLVSASLRDLVNALTIDEKHRNQRSEEAVLKLIDKAAVAAMTGKTEVMNARLTEAMNIANDLSVPESVLTEAQKRFGVYIFIPNEPFFNIADSIRAKRATLASIPSAERLWLIHQVLNTAYEEVGRSNDVSARALLEQYNRELETFGNDVAAIPAVLSELNYSLTALRDLFILDPSLITDNSVSTMTMLSDMIIKHSAEPHQAEQRDAHIAIFLDVLEVVQKYLAKIELLQPNQVKIAQTVAARLSIKITLLKQAGGKNPAAIAAIDKRLNALQPFLAFLQSAEIGHITGSFQPAFERFLEDQREAQAIAKLVTQTDGPSPRNAGSGQADTGRGAAIDRDALIATAQADFASIGIVNGNIIIPDDLAANVIMIKDVVLFSVTLDATYNVPRKLFSELSINDVKLDHSVSLANLTTFLLAYTDRAEQTLVSQQPRIAGPVVDEAERSRVDRIAIAQALRKITERGFVVVKEDIEIEDSDSAIFSIKKAVWNTGEEEREISFIWISATDDIRDLKVKTALGVLPVNEIDSLEGLKEKVELIVKRAVLEQERLQEFEENLEARL